MPPIKPSILQSIQPFSPPTDRMPSSSTIWAVGGGGLHRQALQGSAGTEIRRRRASEANENQPPSMATMQKKAEKDFRARISLLAAAVALLKEALYVLYYRFDKVCSTDLTRTDGRTSVVSICTVV